MLSRSVYIRTGIKRYIGLRSISKISSYRSYNDSIDDNKNKREHELSKFISKVYMYSGTGVLATAGLSTIISPITSQSFSIAIGSMIIGTIGMLKSSYVISKAANITENNEVDEGRKLRVKYAFYSLIASTSLTMSPVMMLTMTINPTIIPISMGITGFITIAALSYAKRKKDSLLVYESAIFSALSGFVGMGILSLGSLLMVGPNILTNMWITVDPYIGIGLFSGLIAYDTQVAVRAFNNKELDEIGCATSIYLNIINILIRVMSIMTDDGKSSQNIDQNSTAKVAPDAYENTGINMSKIEQITDTSEGAAGDEKAKIEQITNTDENEWAAGDEAAGAVNTIVDGAADAVNTVAEVATAVVETVSKIVKDD
jgi:FtsH-binding integral membrane protein